MHHRIKSFFVGGYTAREERPAGPWFFWYHYHCVCTLFDGPLGGVLHDSTERPTAQIFGLALSLNHVLSAVLDGFDTPSQITPHHRSPEDPLFIRIELKASKLETGGSKPLKMVDSGLDPSLGISPVLAGF
ncbi:uncharacterized protein N7479_000713 [Penicillium vulpinum]|uniref:uncharacterized protein n=1 Tax=Penicillium vulpinum TaxID=29845 RepID=UPI002546FC1F|nr:uncharacterized protein N7479_000713 [Penicillium vulpinum]KAJ5970795.1 hypothetical protein N7479_000713 [Penicillium vulpinum]